MFFFLAKTQKERKEKRRKKKNKDKKNKENGKIRERKRGNMTKEEEYRERRLKEGERMK